MPAPAALVAAKAAATLLTNERSRRVIGWVIIAILSPLIIIVAVFVSIFTSSAYHNSNVVDLCFSGGHIPGNIPIEFRRNIESMQHRLADLNRIVSEINEIAEDGQVDVIRVQAIYFSLFFGSGPSVDRRMFADSFVRYEEREREVIVETVGSNGEIITEITTEIHTVSIPLSLSETYSNLELLLGRSITIEERNNAAEVYRYVLFGPNIPSYGSEFHYWLSGLPLSSATFVGADGFFSPLGENWRSMVTSEFGYRIDPITRVRRFHGGIDLAAPRGTPIRSALDGTVSLVRFSNSGFGFHLIIDHGGGFVTLYAHCSRILVYEGQEVRGGDIIAEVGSTGRSTGNHLHFEVIINGERRNPRSFLP